MTLYYAVGKEALSFSQNETINLVTFGWERRRYTAGVWHQEVCTYV